MRIIVAAALPVRGNLARQEPKRSGKRLGYSFRLVRGGTRIITFRVGTSDYGAGFQGLLHQIFALAALRTLLSNRLVRRCEFALGIIRAPVKHVPPPPRLLLHQVAFLALRTLHPDEVLLDVFAFGIAAAGNEFAETSVAQHHRPVTFRTGLV